MIKVGKWIAKHKVVIVIVSLLLLIPSFPGNGSNESQLRYLKLSAGFSGDSRRSGHHGG